MKKSIILSIAAVVAASICLTSCNNAPVAATENVETSVQKGAIVYFNLDTIFNEYDMANDLRSVVETKIQGINEEVTRRQNKLQKDANSFQDKVNKGLLTSSVAEVQYQGLQKQEQEFNQYAAEKEAEISEELTVMQNQIADAIKTFVDKYNEEKQFAMILATQGDILPMPVVSGNKDLDVTQDILDRLNEEYVKEKASK